MTKVEDLISQFEGCRTKAYRDVAGVLTIGYGTTGHGITEDTVWTQAQCAQALVAHLDVLEEQLKTLIKVPLNENQLNAVYSLVYNIGVGNFKTSTMLKLINENALDSAANEFPKWDHAGGREVPGLYKRRLAEQRLFLS